MKVGVGTLVGAAALAVPLYFAVWGGEYSALDLYRLRQDRQEQAADLAAARVEVDSLSAVADRLETDAPTIERMARERFGMIRNGETLYRFIPVEEVADEPRENAGTP